MRQISVLLVDDHAGFISAALRHLRRLPWLTVAGTAGNGVEAIAQCEMLRPDVVLMDLAMPEMGGLQATRLIKAQDNPPYIVIASHFDDGEHREHAMLPVPTPSCQTTILILPCSGPGRARGAMNRASS